MNREFKPTSTTIRILLATASLLASLLVTGSMALSCVNHYYTESQLATVANPMAIAQR